MGAAMSKNNDELVDYLVNDQSITCSRVERAFRLVDRGDFVPADTERTEAYRFISSLLHSILRDAPLIVKMGRTAGKIHLSAPSMYSTIIKKLDLREGLSFLNIGSGTGYLNTIVGFLIGSSGVNHGVELFPAVVDFAQECLERTLRSGGVAAFDWAPPSFHSGNGLNLPDLPPHLRYDRVYCGAAVQTPELNRVLKLVKVGGLAVIPEETPSGENKLMVYERTAEDRHRSLEPLAVTFAGAVMPNEDEPPWSSLPSLGGPSPLRILARSVIRHAIQKKLVASHPPSIRSLILRPERSNSTARMVVIGRGEEDLHFGGGDLLALIRPAAIVHLGPPALEFNIVRRQLRNTVIRDRVERRDEQSMDEVTEEAEEREDGLEAPPPPDGEEPRAQEGRDPSAEDSSSSEENSRDRDDESRDEERRSSEEEGMRDEEEQDEPGPAHRQPRWIVELERVPSRERERAKKRARDEHAKEMAAKKRKEESDTQNSSLHTAALLFEQALLSLPLPPHLLPFLRFGLRL